MDIDLNELTTTGLAGGMPVRDALPLQIMRASGLDGIAALAARLAGRTTCLTMLAGSGSRWVSSLREAQAGGSLADVDPAAPRGLFPVTNAMGFGPDPVPIAGYALAAVRDLGRHLLVVRGWEQAIEDRILRPLSYHAGSWAFATQDAPGGKPRGHGAAALQTMDLWAGSEYVIVNFGGDASSPLTALSSLAVLDALTKQLGEEAPGLLMPAAFVDEPAYPILLDGQGLPRRFGHAKLQGSPSAAPASPGATASGAATPEVKKHAAGGEARGGYTNVGVRIYRVSALKRAIERLRRDHWSADRGWAIPGNASAGDDPSGGEFALDNVDALLASEGQARLLAVARPEELSPVKSIEDLTRFNRDIALVCSDWATLGAYSNSGLGLEKK
jgi:hypothetical protein